MTRGLGHEFGGITNEENVCLAWDPSISHSSAGRVGPCGSLPSVDWLLIDLVLHSPS